MENIIFDSNREFIYHWCGKFIAPDASWVHLTRDLRDYELFVVNEGTVFIADDTRDYTVGTGEYLLMTPTAWQHGWKSSAASFYWLHFGYNHETQDHVVVRVGTCDADVQDGVRAGTRVADVQADIRTGACEADVQADIRTGACVADVQTDAVEDAMSCNPSGVKMTAPVCIPRQGQLSSPDRLIILMKQLQDSDRRYRDATLNRYITGAILAELSLQQTMMPELQARHKEQLAQDIREYISWHLAEPLPCSQVADYFGYNEKYLTTFFRKKFGISLKQYILHEKMERAKALLTESDLTVSQVGIRIGYSDVHNFSHAFKIAAAMTPGEYRETYNRHNIFNR